MEEGGPDSGRRIVGREDELATLREFLTRDAPPRTLVLTGGPGAGKTTLWEAGVAAARKLGQRVLAARPSSAEAQLSFTALLDLLDGIDLEALAGVPAPQLSALAVVLLRTEPTGAPPHYQAIGAALLSALRSLSARRPLLIAVDDVQWLDPQSSGVLTAAARRLRGEPVRFLLAKRSGSSSALEPALESGGLEQLEVGPLSLGALRQLLADRLEFRPSRRTLRRIADSSLGNPLFALELARALAEQRTPHVDDDIPLPDTVEDLLGTRVTQLSPAARRVLLAVALDAELRASQLAAITDPEALDEAVDAGVVVVDGYRVRPSHPLLAAAAKAHARAAEVRDLHRELATVADEALRPRHLALATQHPDAELADLLAVAAADATARGARREAVELAEQALRLTPTGEAERSERVLALADYLGKAGERRRKRDLIESELDSLTPGRARARAWIFLADAPDTPQEQFQLYLARGLAESKGDPALVAEVLATKANNAAAVFVAQIPNAEAWALESLRHARHAGPDVVQLALYALAWATSLSGRTIDGLRERFVADAGDTSYVRSSLERVAADRLGWRGELEQARAILARLTATADEHGEEGTYFALLSQRCEIEVRAGELDAASALLDEWDQFPSDRFVSPVYERCRALVAVGRGSPAEIERVVADLITTAEALGKGWELLDGLRARGVAGLLGHDPALAVESLRRVWEYTEREGIRDPGAFPVAPDLVEALVESGGVDEARRVTARLRELAEEQKHPWGLATATRCEAMVSGDYGATKAGLTEAAAAYSELGLRFDRARSLLTLGRAERRLKKWGAARDSLEQAVAAFEKIGSPGWAEQARSELDRVGARRPQPEGELTPAEQRVAELAAEGLSNKEIAQALFVAVNTVEVHLSHAYAKLGIRSRRQLPGRLSA